MCFCSFYTKGVSFEHICGQAKGYQKGEIDAFFQKEAVEKNMVMLFQLHWNLHVNMCGPMLLALV